MNNLLNKLKKYDYKGFFLSHGEKVGLGVASLLAVLCLAMTTWGGYDKTPGQMQAEAQKVNEVLTANRWPNTETEKFVVTDARQELERNLAALDLNRFEYQIPLSQKILQYQMPADEVEVLAPVDLLTRSIQFGVIEQVEGEGAEEPETSAAPKKDKGKKGGKSGGGNSEIDLSAGPDDLGPSGAAGAGAGANSLANTPVKSRGKRAIVLLAVVERKQQLEKLRKALHFETLSRAEQALTYSDFKIQRQRALPGPNPWSGEWRDVAIETALDSLKDVVIEEADLVAADYLDGVFSMSLARRLDNDWDPRYVVHPRIPTLDAEARAEEEAMNAAAAEMLGDEDEEGGRKRGGLLRGQRDAKRMRKEAVNRGGADKFSGAMSGFMGGAGAGAGGGMPGMAGPGGAMGSRPPGGMPGMGAGGMPGSMPGGAGGAGGPRGSRPPAGVGGGGAGAMAAGMGGMMAGGMASGMTGGGQVGMGANVASGMGGGAGGAGMSSGQGVVAPTGADVLLFRFFDFDVEPNECYRYRIQLVLDNPSFETQFVRQPSVAEGETRESPWSQPSTPAIAPREIHYVVDRVPKSPLPNRVAELDIVQFDTEVGAFVEGTVPLKYGQYVGGKVEAEFPNLGTQTFKKDKVNLASQDLFLDAVAGPKLDPTVIGDLSLDQKTANTLQSLLDQAVTVNRFGELLAISGGTTRDIEDARKELKDMNQRFEELKEKQPASDEGAGLMSGVFGGGDQDGSKDGKKKKGTNSLKPGRGMPGGMSGMGGMGGVGAPGMGGGAPGAPGSPGAPPMSGPGGAGGGRKRGN
jgi:hypothetical protein